MNMNPFLLAAAGGVLIGAAAVLLLWLNGRVAGISGIVNGVFSNSSQEIGWRFAFLAGLVFGGLLVQSITDIQLIQRKDFPLWMTVIAGLFVGFGTRLGSGCTSGHGVCGISRLSLRSILATATFVLVGMVVATTASKVLL